MNYSDSERMGTPRVVSGWKRLVLLLVVGVSAACQPLVEEAASEAPPPAQSVPSFDVEDVIRRARQGGEVSPAAAPGVGAEFGLDEPIQGFTPLNGHQRTPSVASDGNQFFVVWHDTRNDDIYGARVKADGTLVDVGGLLISTTGKLQMNPVVGFDGTNVLVAWVDSRWSSTFGTLGTVGIYGARVKPDGTVLDPNGFSINMAAGMAVNPAVACRPSAGECLVVWQRSSKVHGARVRADGQVLDTGGGLAIATDSAGETFPAVASNGSEYLIAWQRGSSTQGTANIHARRMLADGTMPAGAALVSGAVDAQVDPAVASDGTGYLVAWADRRGGATLDMYAARVDAGGNVLDANGKALGSNGHCGFPSASFDGSNYRVVWFTSIYREGIDSARVTPGGTVLGTTLLANTDDANFPAVAHTASGLALAVWELDVSFTASGDDIHGTRVSSGNVVLDPSGLVIAATYNGISNKQLNAAVAFGGNQFLAVWQDWRNADTAPDLYASRVAADGTLLDPQGIAVSTAPGEQRKPRLASDGTDFLIIWEDMRNGNQDIYGARVSASGTVLDTAGLALVASTRDELRPELAYGGGNYFLVWDEIRGSSAAEIYGARVTTAGSVLDSSGILLSNNLFAQTNPAVAHDGTNFLVVWEDYRGSWLTGWEIYGTRVSSSGTVLDGSGLAISSALKDQTNPAVAFNGTSFLVVWQNENGGADDIRGARVTRSGSVQDSSGIAISSASGAQTNPRVAFDGQDFLVAWGDQRTGAQSDIYAARVRSNGVVSDPSGIAVATDAVAEVMGGLATDGAGRGLVLYHRYDAAVPFQTDRVRGRFVTQP